MIDAIRAMTAMIIGIQSMIHGSFGQFSIITFVVSMVLSIAPNVRLYDTSKLSPNLHDSTPAPHIAATYFLSPPTRIAIHLHYTPCFPSAFWLFYTSIITHRHESKQEDQQ